MGGKLRVKMPRVINVVLDNLESSSGFNHDYELVINSLTIERDMVDRDRLHNGLVEFMHHAVGNFLHELFLDLAVDLLDAVLDNELNPRILSRTRTYRLSDIEKVIDFEFIKRYNYDGDTQLLDSCLSDIEEDEYNNSGSYINEQSNVFGTMALYCRDEFYKEIEGAKKHDLLTSIADIANALLDADAVSFDFDGFTDAMRDRSNNTDKPITIRYYEMDDYALVKTFKIELMGNWYNEEDGYIVSEEEMMREVEAIADSQGDGFILGNDVIPFAGTRITSLNIVEEDLDTITIFKAS